jgi:hypothetical protein
VTGPAPGEPVAHLATAPAASGPPPDDDRQPVVSLTPSEHQAIALTVELFDEVCRIAGFGEARRGDLTEVTHYVHGLQRIIMAQAAARAHPNLYRLLGGDPPPDPDRDVMVTRFGTVRTVAGL